MAFQPAKGTEALAQFLEQTDNLVRFIVLARGLAEHTDNARRVAAKALGQISDAKEEDINRWKEVEKEDEGPAVKELSKFSPLLRKFVLTYAVDFFLNYISHALRTVHENRPEMLRTSEKMTFAEISQFTRMADLTDYMIEKRVLDLSFKGLGDLRAEVSKRHGLEIFPGERDFLVASRMVEKRNLLVHNSGIVNRRYLQRVPSCRQTLKSKVRLNSPFHALRFLQKATKEIDQSLIRKFQLSKRKLVTLESIFG